MIQLVEIHHNKIIQVPQKHTQFKTIIQARLKELGKKQEDLAKELNTTPSNLSHLLKRGTSDPHIMKIIARFLNFDVNFLNEDSQIKSKGSTYLKVEDCIEQLEHMKEMLKMKDAVIESQRELITTLKQRN